MRPLPGHHVMPQLRSCKMGRNGQEPAALVDDDTCQAGVAGALQPVLLWRRLWHRRANLHSQAENRPSPKPGVAGSSPAGPVTKALHAQGSRFLARRRPGLRLPGLLPNGAE
jgi:hypothetical protein